MGNFYANILSCKSLIAQPLKFCFNIFLFIWRRNSITHFFDLLSPSIFVSIVVSIPACHAGDRGSIPRQRGKLFLTLLLCIEVWEIILLIWLVKKLLEYKSEWEFLCRLFFPLSKVQWFYQSVAIFGNYTT